MRKQGTGNISPYGYFRITINGKRMFQHRYVMEQSIGRKLKPFPLEIVNHMNGDKLDNRIENLEILSQSEHVKQRHKKRVVVDWSKYATKVLPFRSKIKRKKCVIDWCKTKPKTRGLCNRHYVSFWHNIINKLN